MSIGSALARGLTDASSGIAKASQNWPQERMEQTRLDQNQAQFDITSGMRQEELDASIATSSAVAEGKRRASILDEMKEVREMIQMGIDVYMPPAMMREHYDTYNQLQNELTNSTFYATKPPSSRDEFTSDLDAPPAPNEPDTISQAPSPDPSEAQPPQDFLGALTDRMSIQRHENYRTEFLKTATDYGVNRAMEHYNDAMGDYGNEELKKKAKDAFEDAAAGTVKERRERRETLIKEAIEAAVGDQRAGLVWRQLNHYIGELGGWGEGEADVVWGSLRATDYRLDISGENETRLGRIRAIKRTLAKTLQDLSDPEVSALFGGLSGMESRLEQRLFNWFIPGPDDKPEAWDIPLRVRSVLNKMGVTIDLMSRLQSGAALTEEEVRFYTALVGNITDNPAAVRENMRGLMGVMVDMEESIIEGSYLEDIGSASTLHRVEQDLGVSPVGVPGTPAFNSTTTSDTTSTRAGQVLKGYNW